MSPQTLERFRARPLVLEPGHRGQSVIHQEAGTPILILFGVASFVLLIACANVANLLLARSAARAGEMSVRLALGARRRQIVGQMLTESCLLSLAGGAGGLVVAVWTLDLIVSMLPADAVTDLPPLALNRGALAFAVVISVVTGVLFGLAPALQSTRRNVTSALRNQSAHATGGRASARLRTALVTGQIALSMALLVTAGLFIRSLYNIHQVDLGLDPDRLAVFRISPNLNGYSPERSRALFVRLEEEMVALPGVTAASAAQVPVLAGSEWGTNVSVEGFERGPDVDSNTMYNLVGPGYFRTLGVPLIAGREFTEGDAGEDSRKVAVVNEAFAEKFGIGADVLGRRMAWGNADTLDIEIVGLVADARYSEVRAAPPPQFFTPYRQSTGLGTMSVYIRTAGPPAAALPAARALLATLDPDLPVDEMITMRGQIDDNLVGERVIGTLTTAFSALATVLAAIGLYGGLSYSVSLRMREIGLRMALGADRSRVRRMILGQVGWMTAVGGVAGLLVGVGLGRLAGALLYELDGHDPRVLAAAALALTVVAFAAGALPAWRASRVDPMTVLRYE
jgi:predicted permease